MSEPTDPAVAAVLDLYDTADHFAVHETLAREDDAERAAEHCFLAIKHLHWKRRDIDGVVALSRANIQFALAAALARDAIDAGAARRLRIRAKKTAFNLAAFTWPGWDEPGAALRPCHHRAGRDGARCMLRLVEAIDDEPGAWAHALWAVGAHDLVTGAFDRAETCFQRQAEHGAAGGDAVEEALAVAYVQLARLLRGDPDAASALDAACTALRGTGEHGPDLDAQVRTAQRVFTARGGAAEG